MEKEAIKLRAGRIWLTEEGIVMYVWDQKVKVTEEDMRSFKAAQIELCGHRRMPFFMDMRGVTSASKGARKYSKNELGDVLSAMALRVGNTLSRVIGSIFLGIDKPPYPVKLFTSQDKALKWLKELEK